MVRLRFFRFLTSIFVFFLLGLVLLPQGVAQYNLGAFWRGGCRGADLSAFSWKGGAGNAHWDEPGNWRGGMVPGAGDVAIFDCGCERHCHVEINVTSSVRGVDIRSSFQGTVTQSATASLVVGEQGFVQAGGLWLIEGEPLSVAGDMSLVSGAQLTGSELLLTGSADQVLSSEATLFSVDLHRVNKALGSVSLGSDLLLTDIGQSFYIEAGSLDLNGFALSVADSLSLAASGLLICSGGNYAADSFSNEGGLDCPDELIFSTQPSATAVVGQNWAQSPVVSFVSSSGHLSNLSVESVTLAPYLDALCTLPATGVLSSLENPLAATGGQASFAQLQYDLAETIYLKATAGEDLEVCSSLVLVEEPLGEDPPPNPSHFIGQASSDTVIDLSWISGGGSAAGFRISYQSGSTAPADCSSGTVIDEFSIMGTTFRLEGLNANTEYSFRLCAINADDPALVSSGVTLTLSTEPAATSTIFVTSQTYATGAVISSPSNADSECSFWAEEAQLHPHLSGTWRAVIGTSSQGPADRIGTANIFYPVRRVDGVSVSTSNLWSGSILAPVNVNELGDVVSTVTQAWTGSTSTGANATSDCNDWSSTGSGGAPATRLGQHGLTGATDGTWLDNGSINCGNDMRLYCLQASPSYVLPPPPPLNLTATVMSTSQINLNWSSGGGSTHDYIYKFQEGPTPPSDCSGGTVTSNTEAAVTGLNEGTTYSFIVCARNEQESLISLGATVTATTRTPEELAVANLVVSSITTNSFSVSVEWMGDVNNNSSATLYYCSETDSPGCNPQSGSSQAMSKSAGLYVAEVTGLPASFEGDVLNIRVVATDPDGVTGSPLETQATLMRNDLIISNLVTFGDEDSFIVYVDIVGDFDNNSSAIVYYCNHTDSPGCDPETGASAPMVKEGSQYRAFVTGLTSPDDPFDILNVRVVASDPSGVTGSPLNGSVELIPQPPIVEFANLEQSVNESEGRNTSYWAAGLEDWNRRLKLTILNGLSTAQSNFPVLVKLNASRIDYSHFKASGEDLVCVDANNSSLLSYEVEHWDPDGDSFIWVKIPSISASSNTGHFWMYYDNPSATSSADPAGVWSNGFVGVWHLSDLEDSTSSALSATDHSTTSEPGLIGMARGFSGTSYLDLGNPSVVPAGTEARTLCAWGKPHSDSVGQSHLVSYGQNSAQRAFQLARDGVMAVGDFRSTLKLLPHQQSFWPNEWTHICLTFNGSSASLYANGGLLRTQSDIASWTLTRELFFIGRAIGGGNYWNGLIDDVRLSNVARSADWIRMEYLSGKDKLLHYGATEQRQSSQITLELSLNKPSPSSIDLPIIVSGTASSPGDHNLVSTTVTIPPGVTSHSVEFEYIRNWAAEGDKNIVVELGEPVGADLGDQTTHTVTLIDAVKSPPSLNPVTLTLTPNRWQVLDILGGDSDPNQEPLFITSCTLPGFGSRLVRSSGLLYTSANQVGETSFSCTISDGIHSQDKVVTLEVASPYIWTGSSEDGLWNTPANWLGGVVPGSNSVAFFSDPFCGSHCDATINVNSTVAGLTMQADYTGTVTQQTTRTLTVSTNRQGLYAQTGGQFAGGSGNISVSGSMSLSGGVFTSTSGALTVDGLHGQLLNIFTSTSPSQFVHNNGTFRVNSSPYPTQFSSDWQFFYPSSNTEFWNLIGDAKGASNRWSHMKGGHRTVVVRNNYTHTGSHGDLHQMNIHLLGNFVQSSTTNWISNGSEALRVHFVGDSDQTYSCNNTPCRALNAFIINKDSGVVEPGNGNSMALHWLQIVKGSFRAPASTLELGSRSQSTLANYFTLGAEGEYLHNGGTLNLSISRASCPNSSFPISLPSGQYLELYNLSFLGISPFSGCSDPSTLNFAANTGFLVKNNLILGPKRLTGGELRVEGNVTVQTGFQPDSTTALTFLGENEQTWTRTGGTMIAGSITIDKPSGSVTMGSAINLSSGQDLTIESGTLNQAAAPTGFSLNVPGTLTLRSGTVLNQFGGSLTYGSLDNSGTINP